MSADADAWSCPDAVVGGPDVVDDGPEILSPVLDDVVGDALISPDDEGDLERSRFRSTGRKKLDVEL